MTSFVPVDMAARQRIAMSLGETLFVEAGAGTGKTTSLVSRIVSLVRTGNNIAGIAAITFTEAAASELRDRVRRKLEEEANRPSNSLAERELFLKAARELDDASIQTLHSFAGALLRERPLEAGFPPGFEITKRKSILIVSGKSGSIPP
jgi:ATP-dependent helicase/nuclease subunit A